MIIGVVIFVVLLPVIFTSLTPVITNSTYKTNYASTIDLLVILPIIVVAIFIVFLVKLLGRGE